MSMFAFLGDVLTSAMIPHRFLTDEQKMKLNAHLKIIRFNNLFFNPLQFHNQIVKSMV